MSVPNSAQVLPSAAKYAFSEDGPDYGQDVILTLSFDTQIFPSRNDAEQRACKRSQPLYSSQHVLGALNTSEYSKRRSKALIELVKPIVSPLWTEFAVLASMTDANTAHFATAMDKRGFKVGGFAYFTQGATTLFRRITAMTATNLTLSATDFVPGTLSTFTSGARVYPCIIGQRANNAASFSHFHLSRNDETFAIEEL